LSEGFGFTDCIVSGQDRVSKKAVSRKISSSESDHAAAIFFIGKTADEFSTKIAGLFDDFWSGRWDWQGWKIPFSLASASFPKVSMTLPSIMKSSYSGF
jgi:hypothetical protein